MQRPERFVLLVSALVAGLVVLAAVAVFVAERRGAPSYPAGTPEATVVSYLEALRAADRDAVVALLSTRARGELERREAEPFYDFEAELRATSDGLHTARVRIDRVEVRGDVATVTLVVERVTDGLEPGFPLPGIGGGSFSYQRPLRLVRENGSWKVDEPVFSL